VLSFWRRCCLHFTEQ